jgi:hypothetical protein
LHHFKQLGFFGQKSKWSVELIRPSLDPKRRSSQGYNKISPTAVIIEIPQPQTEINQQ